MRAALPACDRRVLLICCTSLLLVSLDVTAVNVALPAIRTDLDASVQDLQWTLDAYTLALATLLMVGGSIADRFGRVRILIVGMGTFMTGSLLCSLAPSTEALIGSRLLQGAGGAMLNPVAMSIIRTTFVDPHDRARAIGVWGAAAGIGMALGPVVGGLLVHAVGWRAIFLINVPICLAAMALAARYIPESKASVARRIDPVGQLLVTAGMFALMFAIIEAPTIGWADPATVALFATAAICLVALVGYELRRREPLIEMRLFRSAPFAGATAMAVCVFMALIGLLLLTTLYLQEVRGLSPITAGLLLFPMALMWIVFGPVSAWMLSRWGPRPSLVLGGIAMLVGILLLLATMTPTTPQVELALIYVVFGIGFALANPPITFTAVSSMPGDQAGVAAAVASVSRQLGAALGVAVIGAVAVPSASFAEGSADFVANARIGWWVLAGCCAGVIAIGFVTTTAWAWRTASALAMRLELGGDIDALAQLRSSGAVRGRATGASDTRRAEVPSTTSTISGA